MSQIKFTGKTFHDRAAVGGLNGLMASGSVYTRLSLLGSELAAGSLDFEANEPSGASSFSYGDKADLYDGDGVSFRGRFYFVENGEEWPTTLVRYSLIDAVGILDTLYHPGGIYTGETAGDIIDELFDGTAINYTVSQDVADVQLYGRLKRATRRQNLAEILFATGASCITAQDGSVLITFLQETTAADITDDI